MAKIETGVVGDPSVSVDMGDGTETAEAVSNSGVGVINDPLDDEELEGDLDGGEGNEGTDLDGDGTGDDASEPSDDGEPLEDLGDFSDETLDAYDTRYRGDNGELRLDILTREWDQNASAAEGAGALNEGTYQYLQETYGLSKAQVQDIEKGQVAQRKLYFTEVAQAAGGGDKLAEMVTWGKKAYSPAARKRFNEAYRSGDVERATEAVEALASRFNKANGKGPRRPVNPVRSATKNAGGPGGASAQGYASRADWMAARKEAKGNPKATAEVQRKHRASNRRNWED